MAKTRLLWIVPALLAAACSRPAAPPLPETVAGSWHRTALRELPAAKAPQPLAGVRRAWEAAYQGPDETTVTLYELASSASALDAVQRRHPEPDTVFFYKGRWFAVVRWAGTPDRKSLAGFVRGLEAAIAPVSR